VIRVYVGYGGVVSGSRTSGDCPIDGGGGTGIGVEGSGVSRVGVGADITLVGNIANGRVAVGLFVVLLGSGTSCSLYGS